MKASILYRTASVLIFLFALGHTFGFRQVDPKWGVDSLVSSMRSTQFQTQGFERSYWEFYVGFGLFVSIFLFFGSVLAWHFARFSAPMPASARLPAWGLTVVFLCVAILSWQYFFLLPILFSSAITALLALAAWRSSAAAPGA